MAKKVYIRFLNDDFREVGYPERILEKEVDSEDPKTKMYTDRFKKNLRQAIKVLDKGSVRVQFCTGMVVSYT